MEGGGVAPQRSPSWPVESDLRSSKRVMLGSPGTIASGAATAPRRWRAAKPTLATVDLIARQELLRLLSLEVL